MSDKLSTKKLRVKIITPVVIGSNQELHGYEYVISSKENDKKALAFFVDLYALLKRLPEKEQKELLSALEKSVIDFRALLDEKYRQRIVKENLYSQAVEVTSPVKELIEEKKAQDNQLIVTLAPHSLNQPYIPGSAVKGAIRTAFCTLNNFAKNEKQALVFNSTFDDPFRSLKISDSLDPIPTYFVKVNVWNLKNGVWQNLEKLTLLKEAFKRSQNNTEFKTTFLTTFNSYGEGKDGSFRKSITADAIKKACKRFYQKVYEEDSQFFNSGRDNQPHIASFLADELEDSFRQESPRFPLRIGWGCGALSIGVKLFNNNATVPALRGREKKTPPTSRRLVVSGSKFLPLGWAVGEFIDET